VAPDMGTSRETAAEVPLGAMVPQALSKKKAHALSSRLREAEVPTPVDLELLGELLIEYNGAMGEVAKGLRGLGLSPTTRLKTSGTIIEKMKRETHLNLGNIRDLAGARVVQRMTLDEQDEVAKEILELWPGTRLIDRRLEPSHGYRAVHLVPRIGGCPVEIQLRTFYQDTWAQVMESFGDTWGRAIRYGGEPDQPDEPVNGGSMTRSQFVHGWIEFSNRLYDLAKIENDLGRLQAAPDKPPDYEQRIQGVEQQVNEAFGPMRDLIRQVGEDLAKQRSIASEGMVGE
jgi:hypothetical protein